MNSRSAVMRRLSFGGVLLVILLVTFKPVDLPGSSSWAKQENDNRSTPSSESDQAHKILAEAEHLRSEQLKESTKNAIAKYLEASELFRKAKQLEKTASSLRNAGELCQLLGDTKNAITHYNESLKVSRSSKSAVDEARVLNDLAYLQFLTGDTPAALSNSQKALKIGQSLNNNSLIAQAQCNIGETYYSNGNFAKAIEFQEQALSLFRELADKRGEAQSLVALGYYYANLADPKKAEEVFEQSKALSHEAGDLQGEAQALIAMSFLMVKVAEPQEALDALNGARSLVERIGDRTALATVIGRMGFVYFYLGVREKALEFSNQAKQLFESNDEQWGAAEARLALGRIHHFFGEEQRALSYLNEAVDLFKTLGMPRLEAQTLREIGLVYTALNDNNKALESYQRSLKLLKPGQDQQHEAYSLNYIGKSYENLKEYQTALSYYERALTLSRIASDPVAQILTLHNIAHVQRSLNNLDSARQKIEESIALSESLRAKVTSPDLRATYFATVRQNFELYIDILIFLDKQHPGAGLAAKAFTMSERARARSFLETLQESQTNIREGVDPTLLDKERTLRNTINLKAERQVRLLAQNDKTEADKVGREIAAITSEFDEVRNQIKSSSPRYAALTLPEPLNLEQVQQQLLDDDTSLVAYTLGDDRSYAWIVSRAKFFTIELPPRKEIEESAKRLHQNLVAYQSIYGESVEEFASRKDKADKAMPAERALLSRLVLAPLAGKLEAKRLLLIPDGALQYIPFQILDHPDSAVPELLLSRHEIVYEPSASTLGVLRREAKERKTPSNSVVVFADPVFEPDDPRVKRASYQSTPESAESKRVKQALRDIGITADGVQIPRLHASSDEADAIMQFAPWGTGMKAVGFEANRQRVLGQELSGYRVVHFATHGMVNHEHPELSGIVLSLFDQQGNAQDGFLRLHDIYNLRMPASLVVLSACSTGLGKDVRGEGLIGLTRGFMYAGASGVVASLWKVDDAATAELMKRFYDGLFSKNLSPAAALREAQLEMSRHPKWQSPYYWAGFVIQGSYGEQISDSQLSYLTTKRIVVLAGAVGAVGAILIISLLIFRRRRQKVN